MKTVVVALCCVFFASQAFGQQAPQPHKGRSKAVWTGAGLLAAGLIVMPMRHSPISASPGGSKDGRLPMIGLGLAATGGAFVYWGVRNQQKRAHPNTTIVTRQQSYCLSNTCTVPSDPIPVIVLPSSDTVVVSVSVPSVPLSRS
jgi:hypothetical protein